MEQLPTYAARFIVAIHHGDINVANLAWVELMNRGLNGEGRWVGFAKADEMLGL